MNERISALLTVFVFVAVILGVIVFVVHYSGPARHAERPDDEATTNDHLLKLSSEVAALKEHVSSGGGATRGQPSGLELAPGEIPVGWCSEEISMDDPMASVWTKVDAVSIPLQAQAEAMPMLDQATVNEVDVRALTDGRSIAWHLSWADATADYFLDTDRFCDAVGLQFPLVANATYKMGDRDFPVQVVQWKAIWQKDVDEGFQDVQDLHPNYWADLYWFAEGEFPYPVPEAFQRTEALDYFVSYRAGNPVADLYRKQPIQEMTAEGFSTLTHQPNSVTVGRGVWEDGRWSVVFGRPMETTDPADYQFKPGTRDVVAFAVWEGAAENVSGRKNHTQWVVFQVVQL